MPKKVVPPVYESPVQEEMTVVVVKFRGGPESMQKGFDAVNNAIASLGNSPSNAQRVIARATTQLPPALRPDSHMLTSNVEDPEPEDEDNLPEIQSSISSGAPPKPRKPYTFLSDFNLTPDGAPSLKDYCAGKNPKNDNEKFLVGSAWIQTHGGADPFSGRHLFTVFRAMDWKTQTDMTKPMRRLKSEKSYFENPSTGKWRLTGIGLEAAEKVGQ